VPHCDLTIEDTPNYMEYIECLAWQHDVFHSYTTWCLPFVQPDNCTDDKWNLATDLKNEGEVPHCGLTIVDHTPYYEEYFECLAWQPGFAWQPIRCLPFVRPDNSICTDDKWNLANDLKNEEVPHCDLTIEDTPNYMEYIECLAWQHDVFHSYTTWCLPFVQPDNCTDDKWNLATDLKNEGEVPHCGLTIVDHTPYYEEYFECLAWQPGFAWQPIRCLPFVRPDNSICTDDKWHLATDLKNEGEVPHCGLTIVDTINELGNEMEPLIEEPLNGTTKLIDEPEKEWIQSKWNQSKNWLQSKWNQVKKGSKSGWNKIESWNNQRKKLIKRK
jgi:hypothetical protein